MRVLNVSLASAFVLLSISAVACGGSTPPAATPDTSSMSGGADAGAASATISGKPDSDKVTWKQMSGNCHVSANVAAGGDLVAGTTAMGAACGGSLKQLGAPTTGAGGGSNPMVQTIPLHAKANHCYRVFGLAEATVTDFDIAVLDSAGKSAGEDGTDSRDSVVLETGAICFNVDDEATVNAATASGAGKWALEIWSDQ